MPTTKHRPDTLPPILIPKLLPVQFWIHEEKHFTKIKRIVNHSLVKQAKNFNSMAAINVDYILPDDASIFDMKSKLNGKGLAELWYFINKQLELVDRPNTSILYPVARIGLAESHPEIQKKKNET